MASRRVSFMPATAAHPECKEDAVAGVSKPRVEPQGLEEKERRRQELKAAIEKSRDQQKEKRRREKAAEEQEQQEFKQFWKLRSEEL